MATNKSISFQERVDEIIEEAENLSNATECEAFVKKACAGDKELLEEVLSLLQQDIESLRSPLELTLGAMENTTLMAGQGEWDRQVGDRIGPYDLVKKIQGGGMSAVYKAVRKADGQVDVDVALKLMRPHDLLPKEIELRFRIERQILARLNHPHISRIFDSGTTEEGTPYFVMDFIEGQPLDLYCAEKQLALAERIKIFDKICGAVQFAHDRQVVHRDIKPENILVSEGGEPTLLDFGIAKLLDPEIEKTQLGFSPMTPRYASPEQYLGQDITPASDVYSLGVVLYEVITGLYPYAVSASPSAGEYRRAHTGQDLILPSAAVRERGLAGDLDSILAKALQKDPNDRYHTVEHLADDLKRHLHGLPLRAREHDTAYQAIKFMRRHAIAVIVVFTFVLALFGINQTRHSHDLRQRNEKLEDTLEVKQFLVNGFLNPELEKGDLTVREVAENLVQRIEAEDSTLPRDEAALFELVADIFLSLGKNDKAEDWLTQAVQDRTLAGEHDTTMAKALLKLAYLKDLQGDSGNAATRRASAYRLIEERNLADRSLVLFANYHAWYLNKKNEPRAAEDFYALALDLRIRVYGEGHPLVAHDHYNLGAVRAKQGKLDAARRSYEKAEAICAKVDCDQILEADLMLGLSILLQNSTDQEDWETAVRYAREAVEVTRNLPDVSQSEVLRAQVIEAVALRVSERFDETERILHRILEDLALDATSENYAVTLTHLATALHGQNRLKEAEASTLQALEILYGVPQGADPSRIAEAESVLGGILLDQGRTGEAEPLLRQSHELLEDKRGAESRQSREARERLLLLEKLQQEP